MKWLLRRLFATSRRQPQHSYSGFVLPTIAVLLLIFSLVTSSILFRSTNRTIQVNTTREQQVVYNAASPAVSRAKAKLEFLFNADRRYPNSLPDDDLLESILVNDGDHGVVKETQDPYTLPDETPLDIDGNDQTDTAWLFETDTDGDGTNDTTIAYSIILATQKGSVDRTGEDKDKASELVIRNGPISLTEASNPACEVASLSTNGWDSTVSSSIFVRAFQVNALAIKGNKATRTIASLEMQQDREADLGNKWGAWFVNDIEIFPGPAFRWNGAMHSEGNLMITQGDPNGGNLFKAFLISDPDSCLYSPATNSEITMDQLDDPQNGFTVFQGQLLSGSMKRNKYDGKSEIDIWGDNGPSSTFALDKDKDSVTDNQLPASVSLDPVEIYTTGNQESRGSDPTNASVRDKTYWKSTNLTKRIRNQPQRPPYLDDTYRADNRYGPKPKYSDEIDLNGNKVGTPITNEPALTSTNTEDLASIGLDGYWERRAWFEGLRIIVGQRLGLGNRYGWEGANYTSPNSDLNSNPDPLYPPKSNAATTHEQRQWRTLRDNLAAVQSTAVYHRTYEDGDFPIACVATTAHPGTQTTIDNSTKFNDFEGTTNPDTNFLEGTGTNGWEFNPPANVTTESDFSRAIAAGQPLRIALSNLAHFAGDGARDGSNFSDNTQNFGAFPPRQDTNSNPAVPAVGPVVHPYPYLAMWGDYSNLRRVIQLLNSGTAYDNLSIADKSTLHTASCTLGMLAYNLNNLQNYYATQQNTLINLNNKLDDYDNYTGTLSAFDSILQNIISDPKQVPSVIRDYSVKIEQMSRDRHFGFINTPLAPDAYKYNAKYVANFKFGGKTYNTNTSIDLGFDYRATNFLGFGTPTNDGEEKRFIRLAVLIKKVLDSASQPPIKPKYPVLYYVFPKQNHDHGTGQPNAEEYVSQLYIASVNGNYVYAPVSNPNPDNFSGITTQPRSIDSWQLFPSNNDTGIGNKINYKGANKYVALLDKGMFNGREMMSVRTLDIDLNLLRRNTPIGKEENWLPDSGIVYAFREDALREDGIARPANTSWINCDTAAEITASGCRMNATSSSPQDPPVNSNTGISAKAVDFYADPDRRPHGFRLRNGQDLRRNHDESILRGLSFISDNPVYIVADKGQNNQYSFNLHSDTSSKAAIEEFQELLKDDWSNFYSRTNLNTKFARVGDTWRPVEIIADAVSIISGNFVDGSIAEGIIKQDISGTSSYRNLNAPKDNMSWMREDDGTSNDKAAPIPIKISRNGYPLYDSTEKEYGRKDGKKYLIFSEGKSRTEGIDGTRVNAVIIGGLVPSRAQQSYGGLHNFPRFLQNWNSKNLYISGSFLQLNFSNYATAPFDQDSWEPGELAKDDEHINYYGAPNRRWGYDVGLQYAPAGPVAERFITPTAARSEFYRELPGDDPYVLNLRCAINPKTNEQIDPEASCS